MPTFIALHDLNECAANRLMHLTKLVGFIFFIQLLMCNLLIRINLYVVISFGCNETLNYPACCSLVYFLFQRHWLAMVSLHGRDSFCQRTMTMRSWKISCTDHRFIILAARESYSAVHLWTSKIYIFSAQNRGECIFMSYFLFMVVCQSTFHCSQREGWLN